MGESPWGFDSPLSHQHETTVPGYTVFILCYPAQTFSQVAALECPGLVSLAYSAGVTAVPQMEPQALLLLIRDKLRDGRLSHDGIRQVVSSPSNGETCDACDARIPKDQSVMETTLASRRGAREVLHLHVVCFRLWDAERGTTLWRTE